MEGVWHQSLIKLILRIKKGKIIHNMNEKEVVRKNPISINIKNFRNLKDLKFEFFEGKVNIILGKNNVGKSNLLDYINSWYIRQNTTHEIFYLKDGEKFTKRLSSPITFKVKKMLLRSAKEKETSNEEKIARSIWARQRRDEFKSFYIEFADERKFWEKFNEIRVVPIFGKFNYIFFAKLSESLWLEHRFMLDNDRKKRNKNEIHNEVEVITWEKFHKINNAQGKEERCRQLKSWEENEDKIKSSQKAQKAWNEGWNWPNHKFFYDLTSYCAANKKNNCYCNNITWIENEFEKFVGLKKSKEFGKTPEMNMIENLPTIIENLINSEKETSMREEKLKIRKKTLKLRKNLQNLEEKLGRKAALFLDKKVISLLKKVTCPESVNMTNNKHYLIDKDYKFMFLLENAVGFFKHDPRCINHNGFVEARDLIFLINPKARPKKLLGWLYEEKKKWYNQENVLRHIVKSGTSDDPGSRSMATCSLVPKDVMFIAYEYDSLWLWFDVKSIREEERGISATINYCAKVAKKCISFYPWTKGKNKI